MGRAGERAEREPARRARAGGAAPRPARARADLAAARMAYAAWDAQAGPASALLRTSASWSAAGASGASSASLLGPHLRSALYCPEAEPSALEGAVDVLRQPLGGGAPAAPLAPRRRGCARCVSCAAFAPLAPLGAPSARSVCLLPSRREQTLLIAMLIATSPPPLSLRSAGPSGRAASCPLLFT